MYYDLFNFRMYDNGFIKLTRNARGLLEHVLQYVHDA